MSYSAEVNRRTPTCFLFLIDQSGSMKDSMPGDAMYSKAQFVATAINRILQELVIRCSKDTEIRRYFQVGVIGYGATVGPVLPGNLMDRPLVWIDELYQNPLRVEEVKKKVEQKVKKEEEEAKKKVKEDTSKKAEEELLRTEVDIDQQCQDSDGIEQEQSKSQPGMLAELSLSTPSDDLKTGENNEE